MSVLDLREQQVETLIRLQEQRREKILDLLRENGSCRVQELAVLFQVSEPTIR
ncbi:MAG: DeoR family transcriptional regulator [Treponema sp.]|jgi:DeoR/GlpR family transcriptional regulator of sugar metabolism|nr:DeoR family transcriptional regulator [Treponema sp.]